MTTSQIVSAVLMAVLVFWALGAYNRLTRLRSAIHRRFLAVHEQLQLRHALLLRWVDALSPLFETEAAVDSDAAGIDAPVKPQALDALRGACTALQAAAEQLRQRPSSARWASKLRAAEDHLALVRAATVAEVPAQADRLFPTAATLGGQADGGQSLTVLSEDLTAAGGTLALARRQFNEAVQNYNEAVEQFPTWIMAGLFRFRAAGEL
jgi:LemA protein